MASNDWVKYYKVKVPNRSGSDRGYLCSFTGECGTEYPVCLKEVIPNTMVNLDIAHSIQLPPLASDTYMSVDYKYEAFFVPTRLLYGGYEAWRTGGLIRNASGERVAPAIPTLLIDWADQTEAGYTEPCTLADFLGFRLTKSNITNLAAQEVEEPFGVFKFLAYHRVINDWYRRGNVQRPVFEHSLDYPGCLSNLPWHATDVAANLVFRLDSAFNDGYKLGDLHQRNFGSDYFTEAFLSAASNTPLDLALEVLPNDPENLEELTDDPVLAEDDASGGSGAGLYTSNGKLTFKGRLSLASLRAYNSLYQYCERQNIPSPRMQDWVKVNYDADLADGVAQRAMYLGSASYSVYSKAVEQQNNDSSASSTANPFSSVGARYGQAYSTGNGKLVDHFVANEPGYIVVLACLVPKVRYATGINRDNFRYREQNSQVDMPNAILQNTGYEPIWQAELAPQVLANAPKSVFGYTDKYADCMTSLDEIHGLLRAGESLESFASQRVFGAGGASMSNLFLRIPKNYLDDVFAVKSEVSGFAYWADIFVDFKVSHPLNEYSIPSLQDPAYEHGRTVVARRGGSRID